MSLQFVSGDAGLHYEGRTWRKMDGFCVAAEEVREIAFIEIGLPAKKDFEIAARLKNSSLEASISLVALTGYGGGDDANRSAKSRFDRHLVEPVRLAGLLSSIVAIRK